LTNRNKTEYNNYIAKNRPNTCNVKQQQKLNLEHAHNDIW